MVFSLQVLVAAAVVWNCSIFLTRGSGEGDAHLHDPKFREWLEEHKELLAEQKLDLGEVYPNWLENARFVKEHNSLGLQYKVVLNAFAHKKLGTRRSIEKPLLVQLHDQNNTAINTKFKLDQGIPGSVDWRTKGVVYSVTNQGQVDDSNGIVIIRAVGALWAIKHGHLVYPSLQEFENCCKNISAIDSYQCIVNMGGLALQGDYPSNSSMCLSRQYKPVMTIQGGKRVPRGDEMALAEAVVGQPVAVVIDASHMSFQLYKEGVYRSLSCSSERLDHTMLLVGYGTYNGVDYWLCQNSWGISWGNEGYIMIERNAHNMCGIATAASYPY